MVDTKGNASAPLIASLLDAFMAAGRTRAVLPPNRRDEIIAVLTRLMADPDALDAYTATLEDERRRRGRDVELRLLGMAGLDIPGDQIATEGFGGLSDDHLADIALSPEAIHAIREHLDEAECGAWLIDKIIEVESARPEAAECARRAKEIFQGLRNIRLLGTDKPDTIAMGEEKEQRRPSLRSLLRPGPGLLALAASLLVGVLLGGLAFRGVAAAFDRGNGCAFGQRDTEVRHAARLRALAPGRSRERSTRVRHHHHPGTGSTAAGLSRTGRRPDPRRSIGTANLRPPAPRLDHRACADHRDARD